ncbi:MAG: hypothetical protein ACI8UO_002089 [Verrucomicrobiales bacterium]|jgi:hypothetical protein
MRNGLNGNIFKPPNVFEPEMTLRKISLFSLVVIALASSCWAQEPDWAVLTDPAHEYWTRPLNDPLTLMKDELEAGSDELDYSSEKAFVVSLLKKLDVPVSSQLLVYSTTSLQLRLISPRNPRAVYFNEEIYVGWVLGGQLEFVSMDPDLGGIFYISDIIPRSGARKMQLDRADRCMNCHHDEDTRHVPGVVVKSVLPGQRGGTISTYRPGEVGHEIPFTERFGGWHVTGEHDIQKHWGNVMGQLSGDDISTTPLEFGANFDISRYPIPSSDILPHLIFEHQSGFVNRCAAASYKARFFLHEGGGKFKPGDLEKVREEVDELVRYILFADEAEFPEGGVTGDSVFREDFLAKKKEDRQGRSLREFDLETHMFKHRCSYMIYTSVFQGLHPGFKRLIYTELGKALDGSKPGFGHIPSNEKTAIREILRATLTDLPEGW